LNVAAHSFPELSAIFAYQLMQRIESWFVFIKNPETDSPMKKWIMIFLTGMLPCMAHSQDLNEPDWIKMMNDRNVNYFEAVKAFDSYWANREKPAETDAVFKDGKEKEPVEIENIKFAFEYRKFLAWKYQVLPFVEPDGRIRSAAQRKSDFKAGAIR
jgi:hypothetical protein